MMRFAVIFILFAGLLGTSGKKEYKDSERVKMACHSSKMETNLMNPGKLDEIDKALDGMYAMMKLDADYAEACNYSLTFQITAMTPNDTKEVRDVEQQITRMLEGLELKRDRYAKGLWGYCAEEGAEELLNNITAIQKVLERHTGANQIRICDRDKMLACNTDYNKCTCIDEQVNFLEIRNARVEDKCELKVGSDCPISPDSDTRKNVKFDCTGNTTCYMKVSNSRLPCNKKTVRKHFTPKEPPIDDRLLTHKPTSYRYIRNDYPSTHCQCYKYKRAGAGSQYDAGVHVLVAVILQLLVNLVLNSP